LTYHIDTMIKILDNLPYELSIDVVTSDPSVFKKAAICDKDGVVKWPSDMLKTCHVVDMINISTKTLRAANMDDPVDTAIMFRCSCVSSVGLRTTVLVGEIDGKWCYYPLMRESIDDLMIETIRKNRISLHSLDILLMRESIDVYMKKRAETLNN